MSFGAGVAKWSAKSTAEMREFHAEIIFRLYASTIRDTPVLTGRLRGNWFPSKDNPSKQVDVNFEGGETAAFNKSISRVADFIIGFDGAKDFEVFLTNNLPYASVIEYDGHSSTKAPEGMVRKNIQRIMEIINKR